MDQIHLNENEKRPATLNQLVFLDAKKRDQILSEIQYQLFVRLSKEKSYYDGFVEMSFSWKKNNDFLRIDFFDGTIDQLVVNSKQLIYENQLDHSLRPFKNGSQRVSLKNKYQASEYKKKAYEKNQRGEKPHGEGQHKENEFKEIQEDLIKNKALYQYDGRALFLSPSLLLDGKKNHVFIRFKKTYNSGEGYGLTRFKDPKDQRVYLSTHFQPYGANEFFPLFDQPDLKATMTLQVEAPRDWNIVSTMKEYKVRNLKSKRKLWYFPKSFILSSYVFSLYAGPFRIWKSQYRKIPLRILARQSVANYVYPEIWFRLTREGFRFFENYFKISYPYSKYDQILIPSHKFGAMENIAAVSFNEFLLFRDFPTAEKKMTLASLIFHEMSHMWFGNLVTMKWWNDLWLNESFATYMSLIALDRTIKGELPWDVWDWFFLHKEWAYFHEDSDFAHPVIVEEVRDTTEAIHLIDGITYIKGASLLNQLNLWIGENAFRRGIQNYLLRFSEKNAVWKDLLNEISKSYGQSLKNWNQKWLKTSGLNRIQAHFQCQNDKISDFYLTQKVDLGEKKIRPHRLVVALFKFNSKKTKIKKIKEMPVYIETSRLNLKKMRGFQCPDLVYPNWKDSSYIKVQLDEASMEKALSHRDQISSPSLRLFLVNALWNSLKNGDLSLFLYADFLLESLKKEKDPLVLKNLERISSIDSFYRKESDEEKKTFFNFALKMEHVLWMRLKQSRNRDEKIFWRDFFIRKTWTPFALQKLYGLLEGKIRVLGLSFKDPKLRWRMLKVLSEFQFQGVKLLIEKESKRDSSYEGKLGLIATQVLKPDLENKKYWLNQVLDEKSSYSYMEKSTILQSLYPLSQNHLKLSYARDFFGDFLKVREREVSALETLPFLSLAPSFCEKKFISKIEKFVKKNKSRLNIVDRKDFHFKVKGMKTCLKVRSRLALKR